MKQRVAIFASDMPVGGVPRMIVNISRGLLEKGLDVDLVLVSRVGPFLEKVDPAVRIVDLGNPGLLGTVPALARYLRREKPVAMLATGLHRNIFAILARTLSCSAVRIVLSERVYVSQYACDRHNPLQQKAFLWAYRWLSRLLFRFADGITAVSQDTARDLERFAWLPRGRVKCLYNPFINPELIARSELLPDHPWLADHDLPVVLSVGRLHPQKDYTTLIHAFRRVCDRMPARLIILGEGSERPALEGLIRELQLQDNVSLPGFHDNPYGFMAHADVFVLSSAYEGLPNVLVEALACGVPVVSTDCPSGPSEILEDNRYGRLVPVGDAHALWDALLAELQSPSREKVRAFNAQRRSDFTLEASVEGYYRALMGHLS